MIPILYCQEVEEYIRLDLYAEKISASSFRQSIAHRKEEDPLNGPSRQ